jgi:hypothetical protein
MQTTTSRRDAIAGEEIPTPPAPPEADQYQAWELIDTGRYMPRRICGSFPGRELG